MHGAVTVKARKMDGLIRGGKEMHELTLNGWLSDRTGRKQSKLSTVEDRYKGGQGELEGNALWV